MNRSSIKIIKRKSADATTTDVKVVNADQAQVAAASGEKFERRLRRKMTDTVSSWIAEYKENKRSEEISTFRKLFGDDFLSSNPV